MATFAPRLRRDSWLPSRRAFGRLLATFAPRLRRDSWLPSRRAFGATPGYLRAAPSARVLDPRGTLWYFVPLMVPLFAFMIERVQHVRQANFFQHGVDFLVFGLAVGRVVGGKVLYVSGHTLLLSYILVSSRSKIVRVAAILVLAQTLLLKYYVWGDFVTSNVGMVLGCALALIVRPVSIRWKCQE